MGMPSGVEKLSFGVEECITTADAFSTPENNANLHIELTANRDEREVFFSITLTDYAHEHIHKRIQKQDSSMILLDIFRNHDKFIL
jgi:hypothetical protein